MSFPEYVDICKACEHSNEAGQCDAPMFLEECALAELNGCAGCEHLQRDESCKATEAGAECHLPF